jgi:hypothetical protein
MNANNRILLFLCIVSLSILTGCYSLTNMQKNLPNSDKILTPDQANKIPPAYMLSIQTTWDGTGNNVNQGFETRFIGRLQEASLFSDVISILGRNRRDEQEPHYALTLHVNEKAEYDNFENGVKAFFIGLSLFVLTPALPMTREFESEMILKVVAPNKQEKEYKSSEIGSLTCTMNECVQGWNKLTGEVTDKTMTSLINQLVIDEWIIKSQQ